MTTQSWSSAPDHQNDAGFRAWGADFNAKLSACGLTQTADTGQVNWVTVTRPGANTEGGYEIWRFNDAAHATAPIFIRLGYGTSSTATRLRVQLTVGTGSDGAGNITGVQVAARTVSANAGTQTGNTFTHYFCYSGDTLSVVFSAGGAATGLACVGFTLFRTVDSAGDPSVTGGALIADNNVTTTAGITYCITFRFAATAAIYTSSVLDGGQLIHMPQAPANTTSGADTQAFLAFGFMPRVVPFNAVAAMLAAELAEASTMTATLVGTNSRTYLGVGRQIGTAWASNTPADWGLCIVWE